MFGLELAKLSRQWSVEAEEAEVELRARRRKVYQDSLTAQEALGSLQRRFDAVAALLPSGVIQNESVRALLDGAEHDIRVQQQSTNDLLEQIPTSCRTPKNARLAQKVFGMPELLEHILSFTSIPDLLRVYRVNRVFRDTIEGSTALQRRVGLLPNKSGNLELPAKELVYHDDGMDMRTVCYTGRFASEENAERAANVVPIQINIFEYPPYGKRATPLELRPLGERCRKMLITQPPIKEMRVYMQCCSPNYRTYVDLHTGVPVETIRSDTGITTAQIWNVVEKLQKEHRLCPNALAYDHDSEGFVQLQATIEGTLVLSKDDPVLTARKRRRERSEAEEEEFNTHETRLAPYIVAKRAGECIEFVRLGEVND